MKIKESNTKKWTGTYKGVAFEINNFQFEPNKFEPQGKDCWAHYIILHLNRIPEKYNPESFWLKGKMNRNMAHYDYYAHEIIGKIEFHGGCTWYSKEHGFDGEEKIIKIGCDYQHSWDEGKRYDLEYVKRQVEETVDSFLNFIPDYKYWCCGNGKLYDLKDGILINEVFHSFEYWKEQEWFRERYMTVNSN
jgi:hypothetical protein